MTALRVRLWFWQLITWLSYFPLVFFYKIKNFFFLLWVNLYMITDTYLHDPPPFNGPFFMTPPFSAVSKSCDPPSVPSPPPLLLISDKSLTSFGRVVSASNSQSGHSGFESRSGDFGFVLGRPELKSSTTLVNSQLVAFCQLALLILLCCIWIICF